MKHGLPSIMSHEKCYIKVCMYEHESYSKSFTSWYEIRSRTGIKDYCLIILMCAQRLMDGMFGYKR